MVSANTQHPVRDRREIEPDRERELERAKKPQDPPSLFARDAGFVGPFGCIFFLSFLAQYTLQGRAESRKRPGAV